MLKLTKFHVKIGVKFDMNVINRVHYIGKPIFGTGSKRKVRSIIVKFTSWQSRTAFDKVLQQKFYEWQEEPRHKEF